MMGYYVTGYRSKGSSDFIFEDCKGLGPVVKEPTPHTIPHLNVKFPDLSESSLKKRFPMEKINNTLT